tara:strand:+ start:3748 stop:3930 length:183 start_codon:yes stop_codon:yes gene_type:complete
VPAAHANAIINIDQSVERVALTPSTKGGSNKGFAVGRRQYLGYTDISLKNSTVKKAPLTT